ncbi:dephospho-CoA kinase [Thalassovita mediterranea]|jgi:dephospho-CoA kinase|uniref:Dephospho-CoA kinase n=1 Tax=Thalassovita mediterranea TaxID=340021 RepID=A0A0N7M293_9RHOB|nr:dephospho-CoA kinase [Thalassovita mediterranea]CUH85467.1 Dephospho-CoA kinase [Thalassovita mediterranea]SIS31730.1 dephospho-CoA kinase [Thalassovita mediterranea]
MAFKLGLTGSIGMGKSTTAQIFADLGCAVWDADAAVHRIYGVGGAAVPAMAALLPDAVIEGAVSRDVLKQHIMADPSVLKQIEAIVHPLVAADRAAFIDDATADILVFDIPLLFETGGDKGMDASVTVYVDEDTQRARVMARGTMSEAQFEAIRAKQMPIAEKRARADYEIETDTPDHARSQVEALLDSIRSRMAETGD